MIVQPYCHCLHCVYHETYLAGGQLLEQSLDHHAVPGAVVGMH